VQDTTPFAFVELFAGEAQCTLNFREANLRSARLDLLYMENGQKGDKNPMDLCSDAGFVSLGLFQCISIIAQTVEVPDGYKNIVYEINI